MTPVDSWHLDISSFLIGFFVAGILGNLLQRIRTQRGIMRRPYQSMGVYTDYTPEEVRRAAQAAFWRHLGLWLLMVVCVCVLLGILLLLRWPQLLGV
jgi:hypothetical protein